MKKNPPAVLLTAGYAASELLLLFLHPRSSYQVLSSLMLVLIQIFALLATITFSLKATPAGRTLWLLLAGSLSIQLVASLLETLPAFIPPRLIPSTPISGTLLYLLFPIPLLFAAAAPLNGHATAIGRGLLRIPAVVITAVFFVLIHFTLHGNKIHSDIAAIRLVLDSNLFLACAFFFRLLGAEQKEEKYFFFSVSLSLIFSAPLCAYSFTALHPSIFWLNVCLALPYVVLLLFLENVPSCPLFLVQTSKNNGRLFRAISPLFLGFGLVLIGLDVMRYNFAAGAAAILTSVTACGVLSAIGNQRSSAAEEALELGELVLEDLVGIDGLTRALTRKRFLSTLQVKCKQAKTDRESLSLLLIEVADIEGLHQNYGRLLVDHYVSEMAEGLTRDFTFPRCVIARMDTATFGILLSAITKESSVDLEQNILAMVRNRNLELPGTPDGFICINIGWADADADHGYDAAMLLNTARESLRLAAAIKAQQRRVWHEQYGGL